MASHQTSAPVVDVPQQVEPELTPLELIDKLRTDYPAWRFWRGLGASEDRPWNATRRHQIDWRERPKGYAATLSGDPAQLQVQLEQQPEVGEKHTESL